MFKILKTARNERFLFRVFLDDDGSGVVLVGREISDTEGQRDQNDEAEPEDELHAIFPYPTCEI